MKSTFPRYPGSCVGINNQATEKKPLKDSENTPSDIALDSEVKSEAKPKRGWWQKITK